MDYPRASGSSTRGSQARGTRLTAPKDGEKFKAMKNANEGNISQELRLLMIAHRDAPTRNLKTQILSIYAYRFSAKKLIAIHQPYGNVTNWQIERARAYANNVGPGEVHKGIQHRVRMDKTKLDHFIDFINRPLLSGCLVWNTEAETRHWRNNHHAKYCSYCHSSNDYCPICRTLPGGRVFTLKRKDDV